MRLQTNQRGEFRQVDERKMIAIYDEYSPRLFRYAVRLLGETVLAEDCVAETFSRFIKAVGSNGGPRANVGAYLYRSAHNWITDYYRSRPVEPLDPELTTGEAGNPSSVVGKQLEQAQVRQALLRLTPEQRQVIMLRFYEEWSHAQISRTIGKSAEATRALQARAIAALRQLLNDPLELAEGSRYGNNRRS